MTAPANAELLPCPFCGGEAQFGEDKDFAAVTCTHYGCQSAQIASSGPNRKAKAIMNWNTRASPRSDEVREAAQSLIKEILDRDTHGGWKRLDDALRAAQPAEAPAGVPVAFRWKYEGEGSWTMTKNRPACADDQDVICEPLYFFPPARRTGREAADKIWEALKNQCAVTPDKSKVRTLVSVKHSDIVAALSAAPIEKIDSHTDRKIIKVFVADREDGGVRVWSDDIPGLVLSGKDRVKVIADIGRAVRTILQHNGEDASNLRIDATFIIPATSKEPDDGEDHLGERG